MPIISVEGPRAVGKTTVCLELQDLYGAYIISDTRFKQKENVWEQCAHQVERWQLALDKSKEYAVVVLDGDVFSPLVHFSYLQPKDVSKNIEPFQRAFIDEKIGFPDHCFYLYASSSTIQARKSKQKLSDRGEDGPGCSNGRRYYQKFSVLLQGTFHDIQAAHEQKSARQIMRSLSFEPCQRYNREKFQHMRTLLLQE